MMPSRVLMALLSLAVYLGGAARLSAEPAAPDNAVAAPAFRRIFIPADEINSREWVGRYLSIKTSEFEQLLQTVYDGARGAPAARRSRLERADYTAQVVEQDMLVGTASLRFKSPSQKAVLVKLDPCSVALQSATWASDPTKPAVLGADPDGRPNVLVEGTTLECRMSQRGERTASGAVSFHLELPGCPMSRITLDVPAGQELLTDAGIITKRSAAAPGTNRWTIELGGHERATLRIVPEEAIRRQRPLTLLRQSLTYEFTSRGINVAAQLRLDVHGEPLVRAEIVLDPSLHLVGARYAGTAVPWSATTDAQTGRQHVLLEFPKPVEGTGRVVQLSAVAPLATGRRFGLPRLQPQNVAWQEGTAELLIPEALVLEQLVTDGCRQSRVTALPAPRTGESIEIQYYRQDAAIEVLLAEPRKRMAVETGTLVEVGVDEIKSRCALAIEIPPGERRRVRIPIRPGWRLDTVESLASDRPLNWDIDETPGRPAELTILFDEPGRIVVDGTRAPPLATLFGAGELEMLDLGEFDEKTRLISMRAAEGWELRVRGPAELKGRDAVTLDADELQLFSQLPEGLVFSEDESFAQSNITVGRRKTNYTANIHIDAAVQNDTLNETYTIQITPDAARVERLLRVHFSQARDVPLEWNLAGGNSGQFSARKLTAGEQAAARLPPGGEVWELVLLRLARPGAFELRAQRSVPFTGETALALVSVHDATTQRGTLAIRALGETGLSINNRRLVSVPAELLEPDRYQTARATYHYQPSVDELGAEPAVSITPAEPQQAETGAWAWTSRLESRYAAGGVGLHRATFRIQTAGRRQLRLELPAEADLLSAWVDAEPLALARKTSDANARVVDLPSGRSHATLSLYYSTPAGLSTFVARRVPPFPELDVPVMLREWSIWLPPGYEITDAGGLASFEAALPPTWSQRLFGPLGRPAASHIFNPLVAADWREFLDGGAENRQTHEAGRRSIQNLGALLLDYAGGEALTWGQLLSLLSDAESQSGRVLLVDAEGLSQLGVTPQTRVVWESAGTPLARGSSLLREADLVPIAAPGITLLTGGAGAASYRSQLLSLDGDPVHTVVRGPLVDELRSAADGREASRFETIELWRDRGASTSPSWTWPEPVQWAGGEPAGWSRYNLQCSPADLPRVRIAHTATMRSLSWAIFLAIVAVGLWKPIVKAWSLVALVAIAAAVALVAPAAYAPLFSAVLLAGLFCLAARLIHLEPPPRPRSDRSRGSQKLRSSVVQHVATLLILAAVINAAVALDAAEPEPTPRSAVPDNAPPIYQVYVPLDADQNPLNGKCYVPDAFYAQLLRMAGDISGQPKYWLVTRGIYKGALSRDPVTSRLELAELKVRFDLRVFQSGVAVRLPLSRASWGEAIVAARLDGRTVPVTWSATGNELILEPLTAERYRLEFDLRPAESRDAAYAGLDLPIPRLPQAALELAVPQDAPPIEVRGARGRVSFDKQRGELTAQLGAADRLSVRWPAGGVGAAVPDLEVEELIWVKVRPGTTVFDTRFKYRLHSGRVRQLRLLTDPRLRLLTSPNPESGITAHTIPGDPQRIELELAREVTDEVVVELSFLMTETSGVGNLQLPLLESAGARAVRRWLGVSVDPALQPRIQAGEVSRSLDIGEFLAAWGTSDDKPHAAYSIPRGEPIWVLSTRPSEPQTSVEQTLAVSLGRSAALLQFDASLSISGGVLAQLALEVPAGMTVDQVSLLEDDVQRVARWSVESGRVSVFLTAPVDGRQQLSLRGRWTPAMPAAFEVPRVRIDAADVKKNQLQLYRQPDVLVTLNRSGGAVELDPAQVEVLEGFGSLSGGYALDDKTAAVSVKLSANDPELHAIGMTYLEPDGDRWMAQVDYHLEVLDGVADTLEFEIPPQWSEPFRVEPEMAWEVVSVPGEPRRQLVLHPARPLMGKSQVRIRGRVAPSPGDRLSAPDVLPLHVRQLERFVVLPRHLEDLQQVTWDRSGLLPAKLPVEFAAQGAKAQSMAVYRVAGEHFQASLKAVQHARAVPHVGQLDIHLAWQPDDSYEAVAAFDVEPGGSTHCVLELSQDCRLVHVSVGRLPALVTSQGNQRWRLGLGPQQLPQRIEVVYAGTAGFSGSYRSFPAPRLLNLEVDQTLWTIYGPPAFGHPEVRQSSWQFNPAAQDLARLQSVSELVDLPPEVVGEHLPEEIARWYETWRERYWAARGALRRELITANRHAVQSEESLAARGLDQRMRNIDERLGAARAGSPETQIGDAAAQFAAFARPSARPVYYVDRDKSDRLELRYPQAQTDQLLGRVLASLAILAIGLTAAWWMRGRSLPTLAPAAVAGGVGIAWWVLFAPSFLGLLAFILAATAAAWSRWQSRHRTQPA